MTTTGHIGRTTVYKGVKMRSRLEAAVAGAFDRGNVPWEYEPAAFQDTHGKQYLPDFRITAPIASDVLVGFRPVRFYVEVKPTLESMIAAHNSKAMRAIWTSEPSALLMAVCPTHRTLIVSAHPANDHAFAWSRCSTCGELAVIIPGLRSQTCHDERLKPSPLLPTEYWRGAA